MSNWHSIEKAPKGIGPLLLRAGAGPLDPTFIGHQEDNGRWLDSENREVRPAPRFFCLIPPFDCDEGDQ